MTYLPPRTGVPARHLVCLDLLACELLPENPAQPARYRLPVENCRRMLRHARSQDWSITHVRPRPAPGESMPSAEGLEPLPRERVLYRSGVSAFSNRTFRRTVREEHAELVILGFSLSATCLTTALTAHDWNLSVVLLEDAFQPAPLDAPDIVALQTIARMMAAPFVKIARTESFTGAKCHLRLVPAV